MSFSARLLHRIRNRGFAEDPINRIRQYGDELKHVQDQELGEVVNRLRGMGPIALNDEKRLLRLFAVVKEAVSRVHGFELHDVQLLGGLRMAQGHIAEMATGEGKTVTLTLPASWYALQNKGVHVMTVNGYLAERDYEQMKPVYEMLGLSVGLNVSGMNTECKTQAYRQLITYGIFNEFGFDYLRDHLVDDYRRKVQRPLAYALVDEADSVLIDEGRTPMIIADRSKAPSEWYASCAELVCGFKLHDDYERDDKTRQASLTDSGIEKAERAFGIERLFDLENAQVVHILVQSLQAHAVMRRDEDYIIGDGQLKIIDSSTGRVLEGRLFQDGLHQAIEAKEQIPLSIENSVLGEISVQHYLSLYDRVTGMTGTIKIDEEEIEQRFGLSISVIPTAKPLRRKDEADLICRTKADKWEAVLQEVKACQRTGQPVLIGTSTIAQSEELARLLEREAVPFRLLNAKREREEAEIVANAGQLGAVTVATNMAGRGTDIRIYPGVAEVGGLCVIGTERHESRRVDDQLRGRAGRQGNPGRTRFIVSLEDELVARFGSESGNARLRPERRIEQAQRQAECRARETRSYMARIDSVVHEQRQEIYAQRDGLWRKGGLRSALNSRVVEYLRAGILYDSRAVNMELERWPSYWSQALESPRLVHFLPIWRRRYLRMLDRRWTEQLDRLQDLKWSVRYQLYALDNPVLMFRQAAYEQFAEMQRHLDREVGEWMLGQALPNLLAGRGGRGHVQHAAARSERSPG